MRLFRSLVLYTALSLSANAGHAADIAALEALRDGTIKKLVFHSDPQPVSAAPFTTPEGDEVSLTDWQGQWVLLNFWATWCAPCRKEMPGLDNIEADLGSDAFSVVTVATGRNTLTGIRKFFEETEIEHLPILLDPRQGLAREMAVLGLPITVIIDPQGREIARLRGDAEWDSESARAILETLIAGES